MMLRGRCQCFHMTQSSAPVVGEVSGERRFHQPLGEILFGGALLLAIFIFASNGTNNDLKKNPPWPALADMGDAVLRDAGWVLPTFLAIILSFYAVMIGLSVAHTDRKAIIKTRFNLGRSAQLIAIITLAFIGLAVFAAFRNPAQASSMLGVIAIGLPIVALGTKTGSFVLGSNEEKSEGARLQKSRAEQSLNRLAAPMAAHAARFRLVSTAAIGFGGPVLACWSLYAIQWIGGSWVIASMTYAILGLIAYTMINSLVCLLFEESHARDATILNWFLFGLCVLMFVTLGVILLFTPPWEVQFAGALLVLGVLAMASSIVPRTPGNSWLKGISAGRLNKAIARSDALVAHLA